MLCPGISLILMHYVVGDSLKEYLKEDLSQLLQKKNSNNATFYLKNKFSSIKSNYAPVIHKRKTMSDIICKPLTTKNTLTVTHLQKRLKSREPKQPLAIVGQAKIGKTNLLIKMFQDLELRNSFDYIFYVSLKYADCKKKLNLLQFLTNESNSFLWLNSNSPNDDLIFQQVIEEIHGNKKNKICIILDDFENLDFSFENYSKHTFIFESTNTGYLLSGILKSWFKQSHKIFLLHPWQYYQLSQIPELNSMDLIYVEGLDKSGQKLLLKKNRSCERKPKCNLNESCLGIVANDHNVKRCSICKNCYSNNCHNEIQSLLYVPSHCIQFAENLQNFPLNSPIVIAASVLSNWLDEVFRTFSSSSKKCSFENIAKFAWNQYSTKNFIFYEKDLHDLSPKERNIFFIIMEDHSIKYTGGTFGFAFCFSHLLLEELLAALWLLSLSTEKFKIELETKQSFFSGESFAIVFEFMREICEHEWLKSCRKSSFWDINNENLKEFQRFKKKLNPEAYKPRNCLIYFFCVLILAVAIILQLRDTFPHQE